MTSITLTTALAGHDIGDTIDVTNGSATYLIDNDYAELTEPTRTKARGKAKATPPDTTSATEVGGDSPADQATTAG